MIRRNLEIKGQKEEIEKLEKKYLKRLFGIDWKTFDIC